MAPLYLWEPPGKQISVQLSLGAIERLGAAVRAGLGSGPGRGTEIGGLLLGGVGTGGTGVTLVEDFEPLGSEHARGPSYTLSTGDKAALAKRIRQGGRKDLSIVGYFRAHTRPGFYLDQEDFAIISEYFTQPDSVFLLVRPGDAGLEGGLFFWENGDVRRQSTYLPFPFDSRKLTAAGPAGPELRSPEPATRLQIRVVISGLPQIRWRRVWLSLGGLTAAALVAGVLAVRPRSPAVPVVRKAERQTSGLQVASVKPEPPMIEIPERPAEPPAKAAPAAAQERSKRRSRPSMLRPALVRDLEASHPAEVTGEADRLVPEAPAYVKLEPPPILKVPPPRNLKGIVPQFDGNSLERQAVVTVGPAGPSGIGRVVSKIPLLRRLGRRRSEEDGFREAKPLRQVRPTVPANLFVDDEDDGEVDFKVHIDESGNVSEAELLTRGVQSRVADLAADAALNWQFIPAELDGKPVESELVLRFRFNR